MAKYLGDFAANSSVVFNFNTTAFSDGSPITLAGTPSLAVYKDSTTEITTGITLTVDYDAKTGMHHVVIDLSASASYTTATDFSVVIAAGTVGGTPVVGREIACFSINNRSALRPATPGRTLVVDAAGLADANTVKVGPSGSGTAQTARDLGASVLLSVGTGTGQVNLSSGKVPVVQLVAADFAAAALNGKGDWLLASSYTAPPTVAAIATGVWTDTTAGDFTVALSIGKSIMNGGSLGTGLTVNANLTEIAGDNAHVSTLNMLLTDYVDAGLNATVTGVVGNVTGNVGGDVQGKVLGGGASTITGTGVRAVDGSGNAIAPASTALSSVIYTNARAAKLDNLDAAVTSRAVAGDAMTLTSGERNSIADAHIARNIAGGSSTGRTVKDVYAAIRNKVAIVGTTMTVYSTDDTTTLWTATLTTDGTAVPITAMDPA